MSKPVKILISFSGNMEQTTTYFVKTLWINHCQEYIVSGTDYVCWILMVLLQYDIFCHFYLKFAIICGWLSDISQKIMTLIWSPSPPSIKWNVMLSWSPLLAVSVYPKILRISYELITFDKKQDVYYKNNKYPGECKKLSP